MSRHIDAKIDIFQTASVARRSKHERRRCHDHLAYLQEQLSSRAGIRLAHTGNDVFRSGALKAPAMIGGPNEKCRPTAYRAAFVRRIHHTARRGYNDLIMGLVSEPM
jgi:hypothetical protein